MLPCSCNMFGSAKTFKGQSIYLFLHNYFLIAVEDELEKLNSFFDELIALFGFDQNFYFGAEASQQILNERIQAKKEYDRSVEKAKEIYNNRMKSL
jgi:phage anti-repressor protein